MRLHSRTYETIMSASRRRRRLRSGVAKALSSSSSSAGPNQTRWCTQVIGLIRQPTMPVSAKPVTSSPAATARRTRTAQTTRITATAASQSTVLGSRRVEPGDRAVERLVGDERQRADPVGVPERVGPEHPGRVRGDGGGDQTWRPAAVRLATSAARHRLVTSR